MENDLGPPAEDAMMTSEKRIEIGTTWPSYHSHSLQSADINANQALQQPAQPLQGSPDRPSSVPQQGRRNTIFLKGPQPSSKYSILSKSKQLRIQSQNFRNHFQIFKWSPLLLCQFLANVFMSQLLDDPEAD